MLRPAAASRSGLRYPASVIPTSLRRCTLLLLATALPLLAAAPAHAEIPEGWSSPDDVSLLQMLLVVAVLPAVLIVLIVLAVLLPALARGEKLLTSAETSPEWFGGPRGSTGELGAGSSAGPTGGASGRW